MSQHEIEGWTVKGALSVINMLPVPGGDMVFAPTYETVKSAEEFLRQTAANTKTAKNQNERNIHSI